MTSILCDLISDTHISEHQTFNWSDQPTSPFCIVAGDVARDRKTLKHVLTHLGDCYQQVFYIDGNEEHRDYYHCLQDSYQELAEMIEGIPNVVYLRNDIVVLNNIAIIAANGWWTYDFDPLVDIDEAIKWFCDYTQVGRDVALSVVEKAYEDTLYLINSVKKIQRHPDIKAAVVVSHTLPDHTLVNHDISLAGTPRFNCLGNSSMSQAFAVDLESKIKMWCFGHYHHSIDREINGVRFLSNVRGREGTEWFQHAYYPKRLTLTDN